MEQLSHEDRVLRSRTFLFETCSDLVSDIKNLKCSPVMDTVKLSSGLVVSEGEAFEFTSALVYSNYSLM